jgi:hypothetical protein
MTYRYTLLAACLLAATAQASSISGVLTEGGGIDDRSLTVEDSKGNSVEAYCQPESACGDWFTAPDENDAVVLKDEFKGRKVVLDYRQEPNGDRIAGPDEGEEVNFVNSLEFVP